MIIAVDEQASHDKVDFDDGKLIPGARGWITKTITKPSYDAAESLLYFLDKYTTILGCYLPGKVICLPDPKIQEYRVIPGKLVFTVFLLGKNSKSKLIQRQ